MKAGSTSRAGARPKCGIPNFAASSLYSMSISWSVSMCSAAKLMGTKQTRLPPDSATAFITSGVPRSQPSDRPNPRLPAHVVRPLPVEVSNHGSDGGSDLVCVGITRSDKRNRKAMGAKDQVDWLRFWARGRGQALANGFSQCLDVKLVIGITRDPPHWHLATSRPLHRLIKEVEGGPRRRPTVVRKHGKGDDPLHALAAQRLKALVPLWVG